MTDYIELQVTDDGVIETEVSEQIVIGGAASLQTKSVSYTPTESAQSAHLTPSTGYDGFSSVDVNVGAISSSYVGSGVTRRTSSDLAKNGATITAPAGYYESSASKSVTSGTAGTPTASKGAVSNHAIAVTPSVTNQSGYITGSTITGTAVSVSASELVSGTKPITANGTGIDVTEFAAVDVNVSGGASIQYATGTYTPSQDYNTEQNVLITTTATVGFVPDMFVFIVTDKSLVNGVSYAVLHSTYINATTTGNTWRTTVRYSNSNNTTSGHAVASDWTTQSNYYLYYNGGNIYYRTYSTFILKSNVQYTWFAFKGL